MVGDVAVVEVLAKELRFPAQAKELGDELMLVAGQEWAKKLLVNMKHVKYLSSTGFAILFNLVKHAKTKGRPGLLLYVWIPRCKSARTSSAWTRSPRSIETEHEALKAFEG